MLRVATGPAAAFVVYMVSRRDLAALLLVCPTVDILEPTINGGVPITAFRLGSLPHPATIVCD